MKLKAHRVIVIIAIIFLVMWDNYAKNTFSQYYSCVTNLLSLYWQRKCKGNVSSEEVFMHTNLQNLYRHAFCLPKDTFTKFFCVKTLYITNMKRAIHKKVGHYLYTYLSARHSYHSVNSLNNSAQCGFCPTNCFHHRSVTEYSRNNIIRNYIHRCHEETLSHINSSPSSTKHHATS
jgi:hypothetical protein